MLINSNKELVCSDKNHKFVEIDFSKILDKGYVPACILGNPDFPGTGFLYDIDVDMTRSYIKFQRLPNHKPGDKLNGTEIERNDEYTEFKIYFDSPKSLVLLTLTLQEMIDRLGEDARKEAYEYKEYLLNYNK